MLVRPPQTQALSPAEVPSRGDIEGLDGVRGCRGEAVLRWVAAAQQDGSSWPPNRKEGRTHPEKEDQVTATPDATLEVDVPVTRALLEKLFTTLRDDIAILKQELAADVKDIRCNMCDLEHRVDSLERVLGNQDEEMEEHRCDILSLRDKTADLNYQLEDLKNRLRRCNIRTKGIPLQADAGRMKDYALLLFCHVAPDLEEQDIILDRTHRAGRQALSLQQPQDILTCLHYFWQKEAIIAAV
ncbi:hypothetical protein NDU88_005663 [Pleurodeles waltl]|uniref:Uncharacterized protein n=1 Tax=Pleurodeles waltl TaxID=8319 RepID=A0AAV7LSQ0_PLEWA|nr:hypothetical protein NDU88_005663 [Pleurodeles waltl]